MNFENRNLGQIKRKYLCMPYFGTEGVSFAIFKCKCWGYTLYYVQRFVKCGFRALPIFVYPFLESRPRIIMGTKNLFTFPQITVLSCIVRHRAIDKMVLLIMMVF